MRQWCIRPSPVHTGEGHFFPALEITANNQDGTTVRAQPPKSTAIGHRSDASENPAAKPRLGKTSTSTGPRSPDTAPCSHPQSPTPHIPRNPPIIPPETPSSILTTLTRFRGFSGLSYCVTFQPRTGAEINPMFIAAFRSFNRKPGTDRRLVRRRFFGNSPHSCQNTHASGLRLNDGSILIAFPSDETPCTMAFQSRRVQDIVATASEGHRTPDRRSVTPIV